MPHVVVVMSLRKVQTWQFHWAAVVEESGAGAGGASSSSVSNMGGAEGKASSIVLNGFFGLGVLFCECRARRCVPVPCRPRGVFSAGSGDL